MGRAPVPRRSFSSVHSTAHMLVLHFGLCLATFRMRHSQGSFVKFYISHFTREIYNQAIFGGRFRPLLSPPPYSIRQLDNVLPGGSTAENYVGVVTWTLLAARARWRRGHQTVGKPQRPEAIIDHDPILTCHITHRNSTRKHKYSSSAQRRVIPQ